MEIKKITKHENKSKVASIVGDAATESNQKSIDQVWAKLEAVFSTESKALSFHQGLGQGELQGVHGPRRPRLPGSDRRQERQDHGREDRRVQEPVAGHQRVLRRNEGIAGSARERHQFQCTRHSRIRLRVFANGQVSTRGRITRNNFLPLQGQILEWYKPNSANKRFFTSLNGKRIFYTLNGTHIGEDAEWCELNTRTNTWIRID